MKKVFKLTDPKKHTDRVLEAIKHDIRKYAKREKRKALADPESTCWDLDCKIGATAAEAESVAYTELIKALDNLHATGATQVYIEIMARVIPKPPKPTKEESLEDNPSSEQTD